MGTLTGNQSSPIYHFTALGHGYCPVTETIKFDNLVAHPGTELQEIDIKGHSVRIPAVMHSIHDNKGAEFRWLNYQSQEIYQKQRAQEYGLDAGVKFVVNAKGRWANGALHQRQSQQQFISFLYETRLTSVRIPEPAKNLTTHLRTNLERLPTRFLPHKPQNVSAFAEFFRRFGTHLIVEQPMGGEITYNSKFRNAEFVESQGSHISAEIEGIIKYLAKGKVSKTRAEDVITSMGIYDENLRIRGGEGPADQLTSLNDLTPALFSTWQQSIPGSMVELKHGFKLFPFYDILNILMPRSKQAEALKIATLKYLEGRLQQGVVVEEKVEEKKSERNWNAIAVGVGIAALIAYGLGK